MPGAADEPIALVAAYPAQRIDDAFVVHIAEDLSCRRCRLHVDNVSISFGSFA